jgi:hypothetical protein
MHVIPPYEAGVTLFHYSGTSQFFASRRALFEHLGWYRLSRYLGPYFDESRWSYVARAAGQVLSPADFYEFRSPAKLNMSGGSLVARHEYREELRRRAKPRSGPVPGIHRRRGGNAYRIPGTANERRANAFVDWESGEPAVRAARSWKALPSTWDDLERSDYRMRSWKQYRKHQWKG